MSINSLKIVFFLIKYHIYPLSKAVFGDKISKEIVLIGKSNEHKPSESRGHWLEARVGECRESASGSDEFHTSNK